MVLFETPDLQSTEFRLVCELCSKQCRRPDLLVRHRRRCQGPKKLWSRRKACEACVKAKAKCCYTQPTCARCLQRGRECIYSTSQLEITSPPLDNSSASSEEILDPGTLNWGLSSTQLSLGDFDLEVAGNSVVTTTSAQNIAGVVFPAAPMGHETSAFMSYGHATPQPRLPTPNPRVSSSSSRAVIETVSTYPFLLMRGSFLSPLLHVDLYSLYNSATPDMTFLPHTAMAIACGSGITRSEHSRFFRRAIDAARQRVIGGFPAVTCMQQWDYIHALLIYEAIELREGLIEESEAWSHDPKVKGLGSPFLLKIVRRYAKPFDQLRNRDYRVFAQPGTSPCEAATTQWARWRTLETARRTVFIANIVNYYTNRDYKVGEQLPFYEALDDDLILGMPLPCSEEAWMARSEEDWLQAMDREESGGAGDYQASLTLQDIFTRPDRDQILVDASEGFGFGSSAALRRLIILAATEQFLE